MPNQAVTDAASEWIIKSKGVTPRLIGLIYSFMTTKYQEGHTLEDMELILGIAMERISHAIRELEDHGYVAISRARKPFIYAVIK